MDAITLGMMPTFKNAIWDPWAPWPKVTGERDARLQPACEAIEDNRRVMAGGGRRLRHPTLGDLVYPRKPDVSLNLGYDVLGKATTHAVMTQDSTVTATFLTRPEDVIVREIWLPRDLSTETRFFHALHRFWTELLPPGTFVGWHGPDVMPKPRAIKILSVTLGRPDDFQVEELGDTQPWMMREQLAIAWKPVRNVSSPSGAVAMEGL